VAGLNVGWVPEGQLLLGEVQYVRNTQYSVVIPVGNDGLQAAVGRFVT
jgi:hypothetical protein